VHHWSADWIDVGYLGTRPNANVVPISEPGG
jgi:hypothetical protein